MPNIRSAKKRVLIAKRNTEKNVSFRSKFRTAIKEARAAIEAGDKEKAQKLTDLVYKLLDQAAAKKIIHKKNAARKKSRLAKKLNALTA